MNILMLNYEFPPLGGGASPISKEIAIRMSRKGHNIDLITMGYKTLPEFETIEGVSIYRVKCIRSKMESCQPWEQLSYIISAKKILTQLIKNNHYDICHAHFIVPTGVLALWIKRKYNIKYLITAHGSDVEGYNSKKSNRFMHIIIRKLWKIIVSNAESVIAPSDYLVRLMDIRYRRSYKIIPNGIDLNKFSEDVNIHREKRILFTGRLQKSKNVQSVLRALCNIDFDDWKFDIVGDGPYRPELEKLVKDNCLEDKCIFHGWIENGSERHMDFLKKSSLFVSESYFESFGVAVVEAIASGCSVLVSDIPAHRMFIDNEDCFTDPDDINAISRKIQGVVNGTNHLCPKRDTIKKFTWDNIIDEYEKEYFLVNK